MSLQLRVNFLIAQLNKRSYTVIFFVIFVNTFTVLLLTKLFVMIIIITVNSDYCKPRRN